VVFSVDEAVKLTAAGHKVILVRIETSPEDVEGMNAALGILTARGPQVRILLGVPSAHRASDCWKSTIG